MKVVFFTGAGVSAESGISTFRDSDGLWENHKIEEVCEITTWKKHKDAVFRFYSERRKQLAKVKPNLIHKTIAELQNKYGEENVLVITQNVDNLFERAGCSKVIHLHGFLPEMKCLNCQNVFNVGYSENKKEDLCPKCGKASLKPNIVFFGENAPEYHWLNKALRDIRTEDIFVVIGTMGNVVPIDYKLRRTYYKPLKILNNLEESKYISESIFDYVFYEPGTKAIIKIKNIIEEKMKEN